MVLGVGDVDGGWLEAEKDAVCHVPDRLFLMLAVPVALAAKAFLLSELSSLDHELRVLASPAGLAHVPEDTVPPTAFGQQYAAGFAGSWLPFRVPFVVGILPTLLLGGICSWAALL